MPQPRSLMTMTEAAEHLGLHPETIRRAARAGKLSYYKLQGCIRISPEQLADYLAASLCPAREQLADGAMRAERASPTADFQFQCRVSHALKGRLKP